MREECGTPSAPRNGRLTGNPANVETIDAVVAETTVLWSARQLNSEVCIPGMRGAYRVHLMSISSHRPNLRTPYDDAVRLLGSASASLHQSWRVQQ